MDRSQREHLSLYVNTLQSTISGGIYLLVRGVIDIGSGTVKHKVNDQTAAVRLT